MQVHVSGILSHYFDGSRVVDGAGETVRQNLDSIANEYPRAGRLLFDDQGNFRRLVLIFAGEENLTSPSEWDEPIEGGELFLVPAMTGEAPESVAARMAGAHENGQEAGSACGSSCDSACGSPCDSACDSACGSPCDSACDSACGSPCDSDCCSDCGPACDSVCDNTCGSPCDSSCDNPCDSPCDNTCDSSCGSVCDSCPAPELRVPKPKRPKSIIPEYRQEAVSLGKNDFQRYQNSLVLREIGVQGQKRIKAAKVVIAGAGALGSSAVQYLAAAGVGTIKLIDPNEVALENLQCQVLHTLRDLNRPKVASAKDSIRNINRDIQVETENTALDTENVEQLIRGYDLVLDCTNSYKPRYLINDACVLLGIPWIFGAVYHFEAQVGLFAPNSGVCYRCLFPAPPAADLLPPGGEEALFTPLPGMVGSIEAAEALKLIIGIGSPLAGKLLTFDSLSMEFRSLALAHSGECPVCGNAPSIRSMSDFDEEDFAVPEEGRADAPIPTIEPEELARRIESGECVTVVDVREPHERSALRFPNAKVVPIGQIERRWREFDPQTDTVFICKTGKRSVFAAQTLRETGYQGPLFSLRGGIDAMKDIMFSHEGAWL